MGITIHYKGRLNKPELIDVVREELIDISKEMGWEYIVFDEGLSKPNTAYLATKGGSTEIKGYLALKGMHFVPHRDCEPVSFFFDINGNLRDPVALTFRNEKELENMYI